MKNLKKFLAVLLAAAMVTGFSGSVCRAKTKPDIYGDLVKQLRRMNSLLTEYIQQKFMMLRAMIFCW